MTAYAVNKVLVLLRRAKIPLKMKDAVVAACVPAGEKRVCWRPSNDCRVIYQMHSSWRQMGIQSGCWGVGKLKPRLVRRVSAECLGAEGCGLVRDDEHRSDRPPGPEEVTFASFRK